MTALDLVFNDHSIYPPANDLHEVAVRMRGFIEVLLEAPDHRLTGKLRIPENFYQLYLKEDYTIYDWIDSLSTLREEKEFILQLATSSPFLVDAPGSIKERAESIDVTANGQSSAAFQAAYLFDFPLVSFHHFRWSDPLFQVETAQMDDEGALTHFRISLVNVARSDQFSVHANWIEQRLQRQIPDVAALWKHRDKYFPALEFCPAVEKQISTISSGSDLFTQAVDRLFDLQRVAARRKAFDKDGFRTKCSPTSSATFNDFGAHYTFKRTNGQAVFCGWHLYLPDGHRIYFACESNVWIIGYIGEHLPTKKFPK